MALVLRALFSPCYSQLSSRGRPGDGVVKKTIVILAPHCTQTLSQIVFGVHHVQREVGAFSVTPEEEWESTVNSKNTAWYVWRHSLQGKLRFSPLLFPSCPKCPALHTLPVLLTHTTTSRAVLTGQPGIWWLAFTCSAQADPSAATQHLVACHTRISFQGAAAVFAGPAVVTYAASTLAPSVASADPVG